MLFTRPEFYLLTKTHNVVYNLYKLYVLQPRMHVLKHCLKQLISYNIRRECEMLAQSHVMSGLVFDNYM